MDNFNQQNERNLSYFDFLVQIRGFYRIFQDSPDRTATIMADFFHDLIAVRDFCAQVEPFTKTYITG